MKFRLLYIGVIAVASACLTSCSDWFDVSPKTDVKAEELLRHQRVLRVPWLVSISP